MVYFILISLKQQFTFYYIIRLLKVIFKCQINDFREANLKMRLPIGAFIP